MSVDEIGYGLISRALIHRTTEEWQRGGVGVVFLRLRDGTEEAAPVLKDWTRG